MRFRFSAPLANPRMENFVERAFVRRSERLSSELLSIQVPFYDSELRHAAGRLSNDTKLSHGFHLRNFRRDKPAGAKLARRGEWLVVQ